jgi:hypothetical protein
LEELQTYVKRWNINTGVSASFLESADADERTMETLRSAAEDFQKSKEKTPFGCYPKSHDDLTVEQVADKPHDNEKDHPVATWNGTGANKHVVSGAKGRLACVLIKNTWVETPITHYQWTTSYGVVPQNEGKDWKEPQIARPIYAVMLERFNKLSTIQTEFVNSLPFTTVGMLGDCNASRQYHNAERVGEADGEKADEPQAEAGNQREHHMRAFRAKLQARLDFLFKLRDLFMGGQVEFSGLRDAILQDLKDGNLFDANFSKVAECRQATQGDKTNAIVPCAEQSISGQILNIRSREQLKDQFNKAREQYETYRNDNAVATFEYDWEGTFEVTAAWWNPAYSWSFLTPNGGDLQFRVLRVVSKQLAAKRELNNQVTIDAASEEMVKKAWEWQLCPQFSFVCIVYTRNFKERVLQSVAGRLSRLAKWFKGEDSGITNVTGSGSLAEEAEEDGHHNFISHPEVRQISYDPKLHRGNSSMAVLVRPDGVSMNCYRVPSASQMEVGAPMNCYEPGKKPRATAPSVTPGSLLEQANEEVNTDRSEQTNEEQAQADQEFSALEKAKLISLDRGIGRTRSPFGPGARMFGQVKGHKQPPPHATHNFKISLKIAGFQLGTSMTTAGVITGSLISFLISEFIPAFLEKVNFFNFGDQDNEDDTPEFDLSGEEKPPAKSKIKTMFGAIKDMVEHTWTRTMTKVKKQSGSPLGLFNLALQTAGAVLGASVGSHSWGLKLMLNTDLKKCRSMAATLSMNTYYQPGEGWLKNLLGLVVPTPGFVYAPGHSFDLGALFMHARCPLWRNPDKEESPDESEEDEGDPNDPESEVVHNDNAYYDDGVETRSAS